MDTKRVSLVAIFAALAIVLNPAVSRISVPSPFLGLPYEVWEVPIFVAFLVVGPKPGLLIALIGSAGILAIRPNLVAASGIMACFAMLGGFYLAYKLVTRNVPPEKTLLVRRGIIATTAGGIVFRTGVMAVQNYYMLPLVMGLSTISVLSIIPVVALFNATEPLVVIPISYIVSKAISSNLKVGNRL